MGKYVALFLTDTHLHDKNVELVDSIFQQALVLCKKHNIKDVLHGGDIFNKRRNNTEEPASQKALVAFKRIIEKFERENVTLHAIRGNHDCTDQISIESYLDLYTSSKNFKLYDGIINFALDLHDNRIVVYFLPYYKDSLYIDYLSQISTISTGNVKILITHQGINGVTNNDGSTHTSSITQNLFDKFDYTLVGHYHNAQRLSDKIIYTGSAYQANYGEDDQKGFTLIDNFGTPHFVKSEFPLFKKVNVSLDKLDKNFIDSLEKQKEKVENFRIVFSGNEDEIKEFEKLKLKDKGFQIKVEKSVKEINSENLLSVEKLDTKSIMSLLDEYVIEKQVDEKVSSELKNRIK